MTYTYQNLNMIAITVVCSYLGQNKYIQKIDKNVPTKCIIIYIMIGDE